MLTDLEFHHLGLATKKPDISKKFIESLGYHVSCETVDHLQHVRAWMCTNSKAPSIEIISPDGTRGPLDNILKSQTASFYHICYQCDSISETVKTIKNSGLKVIQVSPPTAAIQFENRQIAFYMVHGFGLIELLERRKAH